MKFSYPLSLFVTLLGFTNVSPAQDALFDWRSRHGAAWRIHAAADGTKLLYGGSAPATFEPRSDADYLRAARAFLRETSSVLGIDVATLEEDRAMLIPLAALGTTDKWGARFTQEVAGVPVESGSVNVVLSPAGELLSVHSTALSGLSGFDVAPERAAERAIALALETFGAETGTPATEVGTPELRIVAEAATGGAPALAWRVQVMNRRDGFDPEGAIYFVSGRGEARILRRDDAVHHFDIGGTVTANTSPGNLPDVAINPAHRSRWPT